MLENRFGQNISAYACSVGMGFPAVPWGTFARTFWLNLGSVARKLEKLAVTDFLKSRNKHTIGIIVYWTSLYNLIWAIIFAWYVNSFKLQFKMRNWYHFVFVPTDCFSKFLLTSSYPSSECGIIVVGLRKRLGALADACNRSTWGGHGRRIMWAQCFENNLGNIDPVSTKISKISWAW